MLFEPYRAYSSQTRGQSRPIEGRIVPFMGFLVLKYIWCLNTSIERGERMKKEAERVAWVSRHPPVSAQIDALNKKLGPVSIYMVSETFRDAEEVLKEVRKAGAKYAVVVLPLSMIARLVNNKDITWLWAEMTPVHTYSCPGSDRCSQFDPFKDVVLESANFNRHLRFERFKIIEDVRMVLSDW